MSPSPFPRAIGTACMGIRLCGSAYVRANRWSLARAFPRRARGVYAPRRPLGGRANRLIVTGYSREPASGCHFYILCTAARCWSLYNPGVDRWIVRSEGRLNAACG